MTVEILLYYYRLYIQHGVVVSGYSPTLLNAVERSVLFMGLPHFHW